jgi:hypothetical protein
MLRKRLLTQQPTAGVPQSGTKVIAAITTVWVTSEAAVAPIDRVFDQRRGAGGSRWVAAMPGEQRLILAFDTPQTIHTVSLEVEEPEVTHPSAARVRLL